MARQKKGPSVAILTIKFSLLLQMSCGTDMRPLQIAIALSVVVNTRALHLDGCHCKSRPINLPADKAPMYFKRGICSILSPRFGTEHMGSFLHQFWCTNNKFDAFKIRFKMYIPGHYERHIPVGATQGDKRCLGAALLWGRGENFPLKDAVACFFYGLMAIGLLKMTTCT